MTSCASSALPTQPKRLNAWRWPAATVLALCCIGIDAARAADCPSPPPAARDLDLAGYYRDARGSVIDPARKRAYETARKDLTRFVGDVAKRADRSQTKSKPDARASEAQCALSWLEAWARGGAYLGRMTGKQADYQRKWDLAGLALAYIKLRPHASPGQHRVIAAWLVAIGRDARAFFDNRGRKRNNHWYWLGLALGATGYVTGDKPSWTEARRIFDDAARDVAADGTLPMELARGSRALDYHAFSAMPLVVLAELARARGENWYVLRQGAVLRLADRTLSGLARPEVFDQLAGIRQHRPPNPRAGWIELYQSRFPDRTPAAVAEDLPDTKHGHRWLGGDVRVLAKVIGARP
ncbi:MAG: alginate lyase family protein [Hyphomicrobiaceae bacterium]|nr:alginate lyase family protein [Hyphomicrobiaceae bacterium]